MMPKQFVGQIFTDILKSSHPTDAAKTYIFQGLTTAEKNNLASLKTGYYEGKVREVISKDDALFLVHSDRLTAFDKLIDHVPCKGVILAAISEYWFTYIDGKLPHHSMGRVHDRVLKTKRLEPVKVEVIVRGYLAGSMLRAYEKGVRMFCGETLPDGLKPYGKLPKPIITPTTKAAVFEHDEDTTASELIKNGICTQQEWQTISRLAFELFAIGQKRFKEIGWILVDTKYEFGQTTEKDIVIIDEVHTPDSSRLWNADTYENNIASGLAPDMFDKEIVRRNLMEQGFSGEGTPPQVPTELLMEMGRRYLKIAEDLMGKPLSIEAAPNEVTIPSF